MNPRRLFGDDADLPDPPPLPPVPPCADRRSPADDTAAHLIARAAQVRLAALGDDDRAAMRAHLDGMLTRNDEMLAKLNAAIAETKEARARYSRVGFGSRV